MSEYQKQGLGILDMDIDDLPELPDFVNPDSGWWKVLVQNIDIPEEVEEGKKFCITIRHILKAPISLVKDVDASDKIEQAASVSFYTDSERGASNFRKALANIGEHFGVRKVSEQLEKLNGLEVYAYFETTTKQKLDKEGKKVDGETSTFVQVKEYRIELDVEE